MDSKQRFSGDERYYEMEQDFLEELESLPPLYSAAIIMQLDKLASDMYEENQIKKPTKKNWNCCRCCATKRAFVF